MSQNMLLSADELNTFTRQSYKNDAPHIIKTEQIYKRPGHVNEKSRT